METEVQVAIISVGGAIGAAVISGIFSSRAYLKKQISQAREDAAKKHKLAKERTVAMRRLVSCLCKCMFWITFVLEKEIAKNGEKDKLKAAMAELDAAEKKLKDLERHIVADDD